MQNHDISTNIGKSKGEIIVDLLKSINNGMTDYYVDTVDGTPRVDLAIFQYEALVEKGIIREIDNDVQRGD